MPDTAKIVASVRCAARLARLMQVGFAGLGAMGAGIAQRLADAGHPVTVWNRTRAKAEPRSDCRIADIARASWRRASTCCSRCSPTRPAIEAVARATSSPALRPGTVWADLSHDRARRQRRAGRARARDRRVLPRLPGVRQPGDAGRGPDVGDGGRRARGVRPRRGRPARDRPEGHLHRRQRARDPDQGRDQPRARGLGHRVRRGRRAGREGGRRPRGGRRRGAEERDRLAGDRLPRAAARRRRRRVRRRRPPAEGPRARAGPRAPARRRGADVHAPPARCSAPAAAPTSASATSSSASTPPTREL